VIERAKAIDGESMVMTFEPHPIKVFQPTAILPLITSYDKKIQLIEEAGIDTLIHVRFSKEFANTTAEDFVTNILHQKIGMREIVVGHDCSFGKNRQGDVALLQEMAKDLDFKVHIMEPMMVDGVPVRSTEIRRLIQEGQVKKAQTLLGRNYEIKGRVIRGRDRGGRVLGFPTANLMWKDELFPKIGVYAVLVNCQGKIYHGVANIGYSPTFGNKTLSIETHILDFNHHIYGQDIEIDFVDRLRDEKKFPNTQELAQQIRADIERAREILGKPSES
jgi:riboflavin kinase/FMN adenylyltransferase